MFLLALSCVVANEQAESNVILNNDEANTLFESFQNQLFQVRTINKESGSKASIGSAFSVHSEGPLRLLATNYHVVSHMLLHPEKYQLEVIDFKQNIHPIEIVSIDVVNDLALVKLTQSQEGALSGLILSTETPRQGQEIYSLGNPRDLGMTVVPGTYNGHTAHSFYQRVLFSGSINPGMSGGPVLNKQGHVVGVNVATSGNQISFLIPVVKLKNLIEQFVDEAMVAKNFTAVANHQLKRNQQQLMSRIMQTEWNLSSLGPYQVAGEIADFMSCWGESEQSSKKAYRQVFKRCKNSEYIYISPDFYTGTIEMEFYWYQNLSLTEHQFYRMLTDSFAGAAAGNRANEDNVHEFNCTNRFIRGVHSVDNENDNIHKTVYCVREYKQFSQLFDVLFISASINDPQNSLIKHYTLSGVSQEMAQAFLTEFLERMP